MPANNLPTLFEDSDLSGLPSADPAGGKPWKKALGAGFVITIGAAGDIQPLDADLTAIAALTTTAFGRSLLTQADAAATRSTIGAFATSGGTVSGAVSLGASPLQIGGSPQRLEWTNTASVQLVSNDTYLAGFHGGVSTINIGTNALGAGASTAYGPPEISIIRSAANQWDIRANTTRFRNSANSADGAISAGAVSLSSNLNCSGVLWANRNVGDEYIGLNNGVMQMYFSVGLQVGSGVGIDFSSTSAANGTADARIIRSATTQLDIRANTTRFRNSANSGDGSVSASSGTFSGNIEAGTGGYVGFTSRARIFSTSNSRLDCRQSDGTTDATVYVGALRRASAALDIANDGANAVRISTNGTQRWEVNANGVFQASADSTYDIGQVAGGRPRDVYIGRNLTVSGAFNLAPITKATLLASTPNAATGGRWRVTDSTPANREAYPDGTNWRWASDDTVVV